MSKDQRVFCTFLSNNSGITMSKKSICKMLNTNRTSENAQYMTKRNLIVGYFVDALRNIRLAISALNLKTQTDTLQPEKYMMDVFDRFSRLGRGTSSSITSAKMPFFSRISWFDDDAALSESSGFLPETFKNEISFSSSTSIFESSS